MKLIGSLETQSLSWFLFEVTLLRKTSHGKFIFIDFLLISDFRTMIGIKGPAEPSGDENYTSCSDYYRYSTVQYESTFQ